MRLGGPIFDSFDDPDAWVAAVRAAGYRAAYCPLSPDADEVTIQAFTRAARSADLLIAEVGAWSNPISPDESERQQAIARCKQSLYLADRMGASCCVNIAGSRSLQWDGPHPANFSPETFEQIVITVREIIDEVQPTRTCYTLETMPWIFPDSPDSYLELLHAIDRVAFGVHLDPVNLISSPQRYYHNTALLHECFEKLGPYIRSCHAKDILLQPRLTTHLDEVIPGQGGLNYRVFLKGVASLPRDVPIMLEHLNTAEEYYRAAAFIRSEAQALGLSL